MASVFDLLQAPYLAGFWNTNPQYTAPYLLEALLPATKQMSDNVKNITGSDPLPELLDPTSDGSKALPVGRSGLDVGTLPTKRFKNFLNVGESDLTDLSNAQATGDTVLTTTIFNKLYNDQSKLLVQARFTREYYAMQALLNGKLTIGSMLADYGYQNSQFYTAKNKWNADGSNPYDDIQAVQSTASSKSGVQLQRAIMNQATMYALEHNTALHNSIFAGTVAPQGAILTQGAVQSYFSAVLGLNVVVYDKGYDANGTFTKFIPDGKIILLPGSGNAAIGNTVFVPTPEEKAAGDATLGQVAVVDTGVSVLTRTDYDPVSVYTKVDEQFIPTFTNARAQYVLTAY